jgi:hypothetical protein
MDIYGSHIPFTVLSMQGVVIFQVPKFLKKKLGNDLIQPTRLEEKLTRDDSYFFVWPKKLHVV